ncbi:MAG: hypothetical protein U0Q16_24195 [Bryobacteraceae bacterium]
MSSDSDGRRSLLLAALFLSASAANAQSPSLSAVLNAGDYTDRIAPGAIVSIYGQNLATATKVASSAPLPTAIDSASVEIASGSQTLPLPLFFVSTGQINAQIPYGITGAWQVRVKNARGTSAAASITIVPCAPRMFTLSQDGKGDAVVLHADYSLVTASSPAKAGEVVVVYLTGLGEVDPPVAAGTPAGDGSAASPVNYAVNEPLVTVAGQPARLYFAGLAPYFAGLYQLNIQIPRSVPTGSSRLAIAAAQTTAQDNVSLPVVSSWVQEKSAVLGSAGGSLSTGAASVSFASGALAAGSSITLFRDAAPELGANERYRGSAVIGIAGVPETLGAPMTVSLALDKPVPAGTTPLVAAEINGQVSFLDATVNGTQASVTIPALTAKPAIALDRTASSDLKSAEAMRNTWIFWAVSGYWAIKSSKGHFRVIYPVADVVDNGAEQVAEALESAYSKIESLGFDWSRRNGISAWPIDVSIEWFEGDRKDRWGEEGSAKLGVQRQGINLNAYKLGSRPNIETMRIAAGHELFHLMQNLYDLEYAPSTWLWLEEAASTWLERRLTTDATYIPATVSPVNSGSTNYGFFSRRGLEYSPGNPETVQNHGYGASMFLESISRRHGEQVIARIVKEMNVRAIGVFAGPRSSPVQAIASITGDAGLEWQQFCESYMARQVYGSKPEFPTADLIVSGGEAYRWTSATDPGPRWERRYQDLSARLFYVDLRGPQFPANTKLTISLDGGGPTASAIVYRTSTSEWTRLAVVREPSFQIANVETLVAQGQRLVIMVVNSRAVAPFTTFTPLTLSVRTGDDRLSWLRRTRFFFWTARMTNCFADTAGKETCTGDDPLFSNDSLLAAGTFTPSMAWSGRSFFLNGTTGVMHDQGGNFKLDIQGEVSEDGLMLKHVSMKVQNRDRDGLLVYDNDIEIFDFPLDARQAGDTRAVYQTYSPPDWSKLIKINKRSTYGTLNGQPREVRRYTRTSAVSSAWAIFGTQ